MKTSFIRAALFVWDVSAARLIHKLDGHAAYVMSVAFSPDGRWLASATSHGMIRLWDVASGQSARTLEGHTMAVYSVAFAPDSRTLV